MMLLFKPAFVSKRPKPTRPHLQSFSESLLADSIEAAESITRQWISPELSTSSFCSLCTLFSPDCREQGRRFVDVTSNLQYAMQGVVLVNPDSPKLSRAHNLMLIAMKHMEKEFFRILKSNRRTMEMESPFVRSAKSYKSRTSSEYSSKVPPRDEEVNVMTDLKMIAECMISSGYENECLRIYKKIRKSIIVEALDKLGFENLSFGKIQKLEWESIEKNIKKWLQATRLLITRLFDEERILCDHVFSSYPSIAESCFSDITLDSALTLFIFPVSVARCRKTAEKIFLTLDVYQTISQLLPKIEQIFNYDSTSAVRLQAIDSLTTLGSSINSMVAEFESSITEEASKSPIPGGGVHQLTRYVMNFVVFLADYSDSLAGVLTEPSLPLPEGYFGMGQKENVGTAGSSPVATRFAWLILLLLCKIDTKSRLYNDVALSYLFLANSLHYVVSKVRSSNLKGILGAEWMKKQESKVKQDLEKYEKTAWGDVIASLPDNRTPDKLPKEEAKKCLKRFKDTLEETYKKQNTWVVPDTKLREELKGAVTKKIISAASEFYNKYEVSSWDDVRFVPEELGKSISDLFLGTGGSGNNVAASHKSFKSHRSIKSSESGR